MSLESGSEYLDSRDLFARQEEIEDEFNLDYDQHAGPADFANHIRQLEGDDGTAEEYERLYDVNQDGEQTFGQAEWQAAGVQLVRDGGTFEAYAEQLARDVSGVDDINVWPFYHIDWEAAAASLQQDYTYFTYGDHGYWGRA